MRHEKTLREPGNQEFVVANGRVLGEIPAYKSGDLSDNQALLLDAGYFVFALWDMVDLIVDMVTAPGQVKITLSSWCDLVALREQAAVLMDQA